MPLSGNTVCVAGRAVIARRDLDIEIRVGATQVQAPIEARHGLELETPRADLAGLNLVKRVVGVDGENVLLGDVESREGDERVRHARRLIFDASLILLPGLRIERIAENIRLERGYEGFRIADIGRQSHVGQIDKAGAAGGRCVVLRASR